MADICLGCLSPHAPLLIPDVGGADIRKVRATRAAMEEMGRWVWEAKPQTVVVISPHATVFYDAVGIMTEKRLEGDFGSFGYKRIRLAYDNDLELVDAIERHITADGLKVERIDKERARRFGVPGALDYGTLVPLYYLEGDFRLVAMSMALLSYQELYRCGRAIRAAARQVGRRVAVIASGDLSHRLIEGAPAGYDPMGAKFDRLLLERIEGWDVEGILAMDPQLVERAGECGLRPVTMLLGAMDGLDVMAKVISYEGPFGVGYGVVVIAPIGLGQERVAYEELPGVLARRAVAEYLLHGRVIDPPKVLPDFMKGRAGAFVTIYSGKHLRGCIGTIEGTRKTIAEEIIANAIQAATEDPRFPPVGVGELASLSFSVDILSPLEPVTELGQLDPKQYGILVRRGRRAGLLLPDIEGINTVDDQLRIAKQKAGIGPDEQVEVLRFRVDRY
ncbi:MAG: AmmeMemoRadiSam system protein A [Firmicutes bacterium]|nr:AmmeMemoRadiSam system protein A [Bacillota bacterium]